jgi:hypothetical protein
MELDESIRREVDLLLLFYAVLFTNAQYFTSPTPHPHHTAVELIEM